RAKFPAAVGDCTPARRPNRKAAANSQITKRTTVNEPDRTRRSSSTATGATWRLFLRSVRTGPQDDARRQTVLLIEVSRSSTHRDRADLGQLAAVSRLRPGMGRRPAFQDPRRLHRTRTVRRPDRNPKHSL